MSESVNRMVLDLSHHNTVASWVDVRLAGIVGVIYKATEDDNYVDPTYASSRVKAQLAKLLWGAYHFLRPGDMRKQAQFFVRNAASGSNLEGMVLAADHEDAGVSLEDLKVFLEEVQACSGGIVPIIYSGNVIKEQIGTKDVPWLRKYKLWLAHYSSSPSWPKQVWAEYWLWQYSDGNVGPTPHGCSGVSGDVDTNSYEGSAEELREEWSANAKPTPEEPVVEVLITAPDGIRVNVKVV
jgi:lysozyme